MLRSGAQRAALRAIVTPLAATNRSQSLALNNAAKHASRLTTLANGRPRALAKPLSMALVRMHSGTPIMQAAKGESKSTKSSLDRKLSAHPEWVSGTSSTHSLFTEVGQPEKRQDDEDTDMLAGIKSDLKTIAETFSLKEVPKEAIYVGLAGVMPYLATSLSTVYCAFEISHAATHGTGVFMSGRTAELLLHVIEPLQIGYGAVIISFLGAIHWGLEWAGYGGHQGYSRYSIGVVAPAIAWPTILLPAETALISQFLAFNFLYYVDSRSAKRGWSPPWYAVYRFVLTFIVGASIVISLVGRGQVASEIGKAPGPADRIRKLREAQSEELEKEEEARRSKTVASDEDDDGEDEDGDAGEQDSDEE